MTVNQEAGAFRRCGKCGPDNPGLDTDVGQSRESSQPSHRLQIPENSPGNAAGKLHPGAQSTHLMFSTGRLGQVLAVGCCLLVSPQKDWEGALSLRVTEGYGISRVG